MGTSAPHNSPAYPQDYGVLTMNIDFKIESYRSMAYTAEDFEQEAEQVQTFSYWSEKVQPSDLILTALRIAANVMRPGVIEAAIRSYVSQNEDEYANDAAAIRKALTDG
jgi:hypothetical protein